MARGRKQTPEQIIGLLGRIEVGTANGKTAAMACKEAGIAEQTYYRCRTAVHRESDGITTGAYRARACSRPY